MATEDDFVDDIDFEIDNDCEISKDIERKFNSYESEEVFFDEDLDLDALDFIDEELKENLLGIPKLLFVDESTVDVLTEEQCKVGPSKKLFICSECGKRYEREKWFINHIKTCIITETEVEDKEQVEVKNKNGKKKKKDVKTGKTESVAGGTKHEKEPDTESTDQSSSQGKLSVTVADIKVVLPDIFDSCIADIINDPINTLGGPESPGKQLVEFCSRLDPYLDNKDLQKHYTDVALYIFELLQDVNLNNDLEVEVFWKHFHSYRISEVNEDFENTLKKIEPNELIIGKDAGRQLLQSYMTSFIEHILLMENEEKQSEEKTEDVPLTEHEQQIINYVGGYIVFVLKKKYNKLSNSPVSKEAAVAALQVLNSFQKTKFTKVHNFLDFTHQWVELVNRGGLIRINDDYFLFIRTIETIVRRTLNVNFIKRYHGEDIREVLKSQLEKNSLLNNYWESIIRFLPNEKLASVLKRQIIDKWIDIRARSFARDYVQILKRKLVSSKSDANKKLLPSTISEPALRKTLH